MNKIKFLTFCLLGIFIFPVELFLEYTHGKDADKWYPNLYKKRGFINMAIVVGLWPVYKVLGILMNIVYKPWAELVE